VSTLVRYRDLYDQRIIANYGTLHRWISKGLFPKPFRLSPTGPYAWESSAIDAWKAQRLAASGVEPTPETDPQT
jgi:hypothetical protein